MTDLQSPVKRGIAVVVIILVAVLSLLSVLDLALGFGRHFYQVLRLIFGWGFVIFPLVLFVLAYILARPGKYSFANVNWVGSVLLVIGYSGFFHLAHKPENYRVMIDEGVGGGYIGYAFAWINMVIWGRWFGLALSLGLVLIGVMMFFNTSLESLIDKLTLRAAWRALKDIFARGKDEAQADKESSAEAGAAGEDEGETLLFEEKEVEDGPPEDESADKEPGERPKRAARKYPRIDIPVDLLSDRSDKPTAGDVKFYQETIKNTLQNFGIEVEMGEISVGPTVTQYTFRPAQGVKLSRIVGLGNDLALALAAHPIRIEAPIPGKSLVGIEVPNKKIAVVPLKRVIEADEFKQRKSNLSIALGQDVAGKPWLADLSNLPHLLVAGATNSGKTVCLNTIIVSLLYQNQPDELKLILVDPKRVEMPVYNGIPHLMTPVITDVKKTVNALKWTISEMERRFHVLSNGGKRNIESYNASHPNDKLPYLVFIIDELADLMAVAAAEVEAAVIRLAQMSRAVGIHLILSTQRPSVDIITGLIKANIQGRIAFAVASLTDSRTILDVSGAEKLLGRGDMLFSSAEISKPKRLQGAYCSDADMERVVEYLRERSEPEYEEGVTEKSQTLGLGGTVMADAWGEDSDELIDEARDLVVKADKASASYLQRRLRVGYARAARLLDLLEARGIIGPADGSKPRDILVKKGEKSLVEQADEMLSQKDNQAINQTTQRRVGGDFGQEEDFGDDNNNESDDESDDGSSEDGEDFETEEDGIDESADAGEPEKNRAGQGVREGKYSF